MPDSQPESAAASAAERTYIQAVNAALRWALSQFPAALVFGEDVALPNGPFGATKGLRAEFGDRVFDTPISEAAMLGTALGAGIAGLRPIVEVMFGDFLLVAMDQIVNQIANARYVSNGSLVPRLTVRTQQGATPGSCAQHSQSLEALFAHIPGWRVGLPATAQDAYDMLRAAITSDDPVLVMESRRLYPTKGIVDLNTPAPSIGGCRLARPGEAFTLVTWSTMVAPAVSAAEALAAEGIDGEVLDVRWLAPLDLGGILRSVARTGRLVVVHEANRTGGFGAEIVTRVTEELGRDLESVPLRVAAPDVRVPAAPRLSSAILPSAATISDRIRSWLDSPVRTDRAGNAVTSRWRMQ
jgi:pyruvate/2-oxoglutarate/acetoin dehydrogenase E1 component